MGRERKWKLDETECWSGRTDNSTVLRAYHSSMMVAIATALVICYTKESVQGLLCGFIHHSTYIILQVQVGSSPHQLHHHISSTPPGGFNECSVSTLCSDRQCVGTNIHNIEQAQGFFSRQEKDHSTQEPHTKTKYNLSVQYTLEFHFRFGVKQPVQLCMPIYIHEIHECMDV